MSPYLYAIQQAPTDAKRDSLDRVGEALASIDNEQSTATWADACFVAAGALSTRLLLSAEGGHVTKPASYTGSTTGRRQRR